MQESWHSAQDLLPIPFNTIFFFSPCNHHIRLQPEIVNLNLFIIWVGLKPIHSSYLQKPACIDHTEEGRCNKTYINTPFQLHPCLPSSAHSSIPHHFRMLWCSQHIKRLQMTVEVTLVGAKGFHLPIKRKGRRRTFASSVISLCKNPGGDQQPGRSKSRTFT